MATKPTLNWFDKVIGAWAKLAVGETKSNVYVVKIAFAGVSFIAILMVYRVFWKVLGVFDFASPIAGLALAVLYALCCALIFSATHSAEEIASADLSSRDRWVYTILGFLIFPIGLMAGMLFLIWLE